MDELTIVHVITFVIWYVAIVVGLYFTIDYRIRALLREGWLCWLFAILWPVSIPGYTVFYLWEED